MQYQKFRLFKHKSPNSYENQFLKFLNILYNLLSMEWYIFLIFKDLIDIKEETQIHFFKEFLRVIYGVDQIINRDNMY